MGEFHMLKLIRDNQMLKPVPVLDDDYIEKMADFYTSETAEIIYPSLHTVPFAEWLYRQYYLSFENIS